jgi:hypothetical protein
LRLRATPDEALKYGTGQNADAAKNHLVKQGIADCA